MYDVKLSFAYVLKGGQREHHLFAFMDGPFTIGEPTSDYLGFFGFGSSNYDGNAVSPLLRNTDLQFFDNIDQGVVHKLRDLIKLVNAIGEFFYIDPIELKKIFRYFFIGEYDGNDEFMGYELVDLQKLGVIDFDVKKPHIDLGICCGVNRKGEKFFGLEVPNSINLSSPSIKSSAMYDEFNWELSTRLGDWLHIKGILNKMMRHNFITRSHEEQNDMIRSLKEKASQICNY